MAISNTSILIKRSGVGGTSTPSTLKAGELAYSYASNNFFIGSPTGDGAVAVGGLNTFNAVNNATNANTAATIVKRDANGAFYGRLFGVSNTAVALNTSQNFSITGDVLATAVGFDGTGAVALSSSLNTINPNTGTFGGVGAIPVITVGANGRITSVTTAAPASSAFNISDGTTSNTINGGSTFYHKGTNGITSAVTANTVTFGTDNTILRSNTSGLGTQIISTNLTVSSNLTVTGNLNVTGNITSQNYNTITVSDPLLVLGVGNYTTDVVDIGFVAHYNDGANAHTGIFRDSNGNKDWYFFKGYTPEVDANTNIDISDASFRKANVNFDYGKGNVIATTITSGSLSLTTALPVASGGTGQSSFTSGTMLVGSGTNGLAQIANVSTSIAQNFGSASVVPVFQTDAYGRVSSVANTSIAIDAAAVTSGTLPVTRGGTNGTSFTNNQITYFDGTKIASLANTGTAGTYGSASYLPIITTDAFGRVSGVANTQIQVDTAAIISGTLGYTRGGTGSTSYTTSNLLVAGATGFVSLANASYSLTGALQANNTLTSLTVDAYGRVTAATGAAISGLTVSQGGTGFATATTNGIVYGNGTAALGVTAVAGGGSDQTWSNQILTVTNAGVPVWSSAMDGGTF